MVKNMVTLNEGIILVDKSGIIIGWSHVLESITGYSPDECLGQSINDVYEKLLKPPNGFSDILGRTKINEHQYAHPPINSTLNFDDDPNIIEIYHKSGKTIQISCLPIVVQCKNNSLKSYIIHNGIKENQQKRLSKSIYEQPPQAICIYQDNKWIWVNSDNEITAITGYSIDELSTDNSEGLFKIVHPEEIQNIKIFFQEHLCKESHSDTHHYRVLHKEGCIHWIQITASFIQLNGKAALHLKICNPDGLNPYNVKYDDKTFSTINHRSWSRSILEAFPDTILVHNIDGMIIDYICKKSDSSILLSNVIFGKSIHEILPACAVKKIEQSITYIFQSGEQQTLEFNLDEAMGTRSFEIRIIPLESSRILSVIRDITEQKELAKSLKQYTIRLEILREIERAMLTAQTPMLIAQVLIKRLSKLIPFDIASIISYNIQSKQASLLAKKPDDMTTTYLDIHEIVDILENNTPQLFNGKIVASDDLSRQSNLNPFEKSLLKSGIRSLLLIPLINQSELVGIFNIVSCIPDIYTNTHIDIIQEVSDSLAIAIKQARLLETERLQRQQSESLREATSALVSTLDLSELFKIILDKLEKVIHFDHAQVMIYSDNSLNIVAGKYCNMKCESDQKLNSYNTDIFNEIVQQKKAVIKNNSNSKTKGFLHINEQGWLGVPLMRQGAVIGQISFSSHTQPYTNEDASLAQSFANQASLAIENAFLFKQTQRRAEEAETLRQATATIISTLNLNQLLENILAQLERVIPYNYAYLILVNNDRLCVVAERNQEGTKSFIGFEASANNEVFKEMKTTKQAIILDNVANDTRFEKWRVEDNFVRSWLGVPLMRRGEVFGQLSLHSWKIGTYTDNDKALAQAFANQASSAIENAQLLDQLEKRVKDRTRELAALFELASISNEITEINQILHKSLKISLDSIAHKKGTIHLYHPHEKKFQLVAHENLPKRMLETLNNIPIGGGLVSCVFNQKKRIISNNIYSDPHSLFYLSKHIKSFACVCTPLCVKENFIGILSVYSDNVHKISSGDLALLETISDQIAIAVENAQLRKQAQYSAVMEERHRLARDLHDSVSQTLYSQALFADLCIKLFTSGKTDQLTKNLQDIKISAYQSLKEMRLLLYELQPSALEETGIIEAIEMRLESVERRAGIDAKLNVEGIIEMPKTLEREIHHIITEALNNSLKHACAMNINIKFINKPGFLEITILDNGTGFNPDIVKGGYGLESMRQRAKQIGAKLSIITNPADGTEVSIKIDHKNFMKSDDISSSRI